MYYPKGMKRRLRKGDVGEAIFRDWFERRLGNLCSSRGYVLEQQGYNPGGYVDRSKKKHLKEESDPDFAIYSQKSGVPVVGISINTQAKFYTAESAMGKGCIKCPRAHSCHNGNEMNLWYNKYNLTDYAKFEQRFNVGTCMVTLLVRVDSIAKWVKKQRYEKLVHAYIAGVRNLSPPEGERVRDVVHFLRHGKRKRWERPVEIKWVLRSQLEEITPKKLSVMKGKIPYWVTGGRVERGRPRPVCCVDAKDAQAETNLIRRLRSLLI